MVLENDNSVRNYAAHIMEKSHKYRNQIVSIVFLILSFLLQQTVLNALYAIKAIHEWLLPTNGDFGFTE